MKNIISLFIALIATFSCFAQLSPNAILEQRGEVYFKFKVAPENLNELSKTISIDGYRDGFCYAYANAREFEKFSHLNYEIEPVREYYQRDEELTMATQMSDIFSWNCYPTYDIYVELMEYFAETYPNICKLDTIGTTFSGYKLLAVKISDNVNTDEAEPEFFLGGQMHGDELIGGMLCLKLIDKLLREYNTNQKITNLVDNMEIFINPLSNPEGTYLIGGNDVKYAIRYTRDGFGADHFIDINRNFPDAIAGEHPDSLPYSVETEAFMRYADEHNFVMSANIHSGAEVVNYPYDTYSMVPADNDWWKLISSEYVSIVREASDNQYFDGAGFENGYINGYAWYTITGSRQDYMNYFKNCREVTFELSNEKKLAANSLPTILSYNEQAMIAYMNHANYGLRGFVTDSITGEPLRAMILIRDHDYFNSQVYSFLPTGEYYRYLKAGTYDVSYYADGYIHKTITVNISDDDTTRLDVQLVAGYDPENIDEAPADVTGIFPNPVTDVLYIGNAVNIDKIQVFDMTGRLLIDEGKSLVSIDVSAFDRGTYFIRLFSNGKSTIEKFVKM